MDQIQANLGTALETLQKGGSAHIEGANLNASLFAMGFLLQPYGHSGMKLRPSLDETFLHCAKVAATAVKTFFRIAGLWLC